MKDQTPTPEDLTDTQLRIMHEIAEKEESGAPTRQKDIAEATSLSPGHISTQIQHLEQHSLLDVDRTQKQHQINVTKRGLFALRTARSGAGSEPNYMLRLHKFQVKFQITNTDELISNNGGDWRRKVISQDIETFNEQNNVATLTTGKTTVSVSKKHLIVRIENKYGNDPEALVMDALEECVQRAETVSNKYPIEISDNHQTVSGQVTNQHLALLRDPLSRLVHKTDQSEAELHIKDHRDRKRFLIDKSNGIHELEAGTHFGNHGTASEDIQAVQKFYRRIIRYENQQPQHMLRTRHGYGC
jgi:hypothetical protein|nr:MAG: hypothetical protein J07AB56_00700 [Candidatus Nanosalinarum sp. J07AB56]